MPYLSVLAHQQQTVYFIVLKIFFFIVIKPISSADCVLLYRCLFSSLTLQAISLPSSYSIKNWNFCKQKQPFRRTSEIYIVDFHTTYLVHLHSLLEAYKERQERQIFSFPQAEVRNNFRRELEAQGKIQTHKSTAILKVVKMNCYTVYQMAIFYEPFCKVREFPVSTKNQLYECH